MELLKIKLLNANQVLKRGKKKQMTLEQSFRVIQTEEKT